MKQVSLCILSLISCCHCSTAAANDAAGLTLQKAGSADVYFAYDGQPMLSFGGISDFIFYAAPDAYDFHTWVDWATSHGMNHVRAYPPLSWQHQEAFARLNGGDVKNIVFPYVETSPGSRDFDLTQFNPKYWDRVAEQLAYLQQKGIVVHLLMWNGWQLRTHASHSSPTARFDWSGHFFNPANNINTFTDHLGPDHERRFAIYHSVADGQHALATAQRAWFEKLSELSSGFDNVYFDLVHELAEHRGDWDKTQQWIEHMALATRRRFEKESKRPCILGMDTGGFSAEQREWVFTRPYFDVLIYGKKHTVANAWQWRQQFKKPYIPQESWDDDGTKYRLIYQEDRDHIRKYMWKFMMAKCQQLDLYIKPLRREGDERLAAHPHNYNPLGKNAFEDDALVLRDFWNRIVDYPNLRPVGSIDRAPGTHRYLLASDRETILYLSSGTGKRGVEFPATTVELTELPLAARDDYRIDIVDPKAKRGVVATQLMTVEEGGSVRVELPKFTDDLAVHITASKHRDEEAQPIRFEKLVLSDQYYCDGIASGDINGDGKRDIVAGPFWYEGPDFQKAHAFYEPIPLPPAESPSNSMFSFVHDFSGDGRADILVLGRVHKHPAIWYENPGDGDSLWEGHYAFERVRGESPTLVDLDGDGLPQVICHWDGCWGSIEPRREDARAPWRFEPVGPDEGWPQFYHGEGVGDLNNDGRLDLIINDGWYEQPEAGDMTEWPFHRERFSQDRGGAQMYAYDVDGDGDHDVISAVHAHEWGLAWYEHKRVGNDIRFREHLIMGDRAQQKAFGTAFTQPHALDIADIDGDGLKDIVTGKRMWAHGPNGDVEPNADPVLYWFQLTRSDDGTVRYIPHEIDDRSGVGVQVHAADVNGDGRVDILTASKLGTFVFLNRGR